MRFHKPAAVILAIVLGASALGYLFARAIDIEFADENLPANHENYEIK